MLADVNQAFKPEPLQELWQISDEEINSLAEPISRMLPDLSPKSAQWLDKVIDPLTLIAAGYAIVGSRLAIEKQIIDQYRTQYGSENARNSPKNGARNGTEFAGEYQDTGNANTGSTAEARLYELFR